VLQSRFFKEFKDPYFETEVDGRLISRYPVAAAVLAMPFYGIPLATGWMAHPPNAWLVYPWTGFFVAKFASAFITALAVLMLFYCARELTDAKSSATLALVFAFGTSAWSTASQALWQQTPSLLLQMIGLWFLLRGRRQGALAVAPGAFFFSAATIARTNDGFAALFFTVFILIAYRSAFWRWVLWAIPPALFFFAYNAIYNGSPLVFGYQEGFTQGMSLPRPEGLLGLFVSPSRGLLIYSPFLILALYGVWIARWQNERLFYFFSSIVFLTSVLFLSMFQGWDGGWGYGTRLLVDVLPYAMLLLVPVLPQLHGWARGAFWAAAVYAAVLQAFGLWDYGVRWHWHWANLDFNVWSIAESEPLFYLKQYLDMGTRFLGRFLSR